MGYLIGIHNFMSNFQIWDMMIHGRWAINRIFVMGSFHLLEIASIPTQNGDESNHDGNFMGIS